MKKLTPKAINEVLDFAFQKLPFHVYSVTCDVMDVAWKQYTRKGTKHPKIQLKRCEKGHSSPKGYKK
jgi:hypothetical protein